LAFLPVLAIIVIGDAIAVYASYLAISVWHGLAVPIYRSRALWTGFLAILFALVYALSVDVGAIFPPPYTILALIAIYLLLYPLVLAVLFIWIDRTIGTLIRLDYLRRDLVGWRRLRLAYWVIAISSLVLNYSVVVNYSVYFPTFFVYTLETLLIIFALAYGSIALVVGSRRTKDMTFRSYAKWSGYCVLAIILASAGFLVTNDMTLLSIPAIPISYSLYKMAKYLVPVGKLTEPEV
jgi:hypothetical protein